MNQRGSYAPIGMSTASNGPARSPIDAVLMPIGAYDPRWFMSAVHMDPEEAVAAFAAVRSAHPEHPSVMAAMHWGTFVLTDEPVDEPPRRARAAWERAGFLPDELWLFVPGETRVLRCRGRVSGEARL